MWQWVRCLWTSSEPTAWTAAKPTDADSATLHEAALTGDVDLLRQRLMSSNADVNLRDEQKSTPLHLAAKNGHSGCVDLLLRKEVKARLDLRDRWGRTALHSAVVWCQLDVAGQLLRSCELAARIKDDEGKTVLHTACAMGLGLPFLTELLAQGADINALDMRQWTPLMSAVAVQNYGIVEFLLEHGRADPNAPSPDRAPTTALRLAVEKCNLPLVRLLLRYGARVDSDDCSAKSSLKQRPVSGVGVQRKKNDSKSMATFSLSLVTDAKPVSFCIAAAILHAGSLEPEWDALIRLYMQFIRNRPPNERPELRYLIELSVAAGLDVSRQAVSKVQRRHGLSQETDGWLLGIFSKYRMKSLRHLAALAIRDAVRDTSTGNLTSSLQNSDQPRLVADLVSLRHF